MKNFGTGVLNGEEIMRVSQHNNTSKYTTDVPLPLEHNLASDLCVLPFHQTSIACISIHFKNRIYDFRRKISQEGHIGYSSFIRHNTGNEKYIFLLFIIKFL